MGLVRARRVTGVPPAAQPLKTVHDIAGLIEYRVPDARHHLAGARRKARSCQPDSLHCRLILWANKTVSSISPRRKSQSRNRNIGNKHPYDSTRVPVCFLQVRFGFATVSILRIACRIFSCPNRDSTCKPILHRQPARIIGPRCRANAQCASTPV